MQHEQAVDVVIVGGGIAGSTLAANLAQAGLGVEIRLYVDYAIALRGTYSGEQGARNMLKAFDAAGLLGGQRISAANPIGPYRAFPSQDASLDDPFVEGAVLSNSSIELKVRNIVPILRPLLIHNEQFSR